MYPSGRYTRVNAISTASKLLQSGLGVGRWNFHSCDLTVCGLNTGVTPSSYEIDITYGLLRVYSHGVGVSTDSETVAETAAAPLLRLLRFTAGHVVVCVAFYDLSHPLFTGVCFLGGLSLFFPIAVTCTSNAKNYPMGEHLNDGWKRQLSGQ